MKEVKYKMIMIPLDRDAITGDVCKHIISVDKKQIK